MPSVGWVRFVMLAAMGKAIRKNCTVSIVGPGNLGTALAANLTRIGHEIKFLVVRPTLRVPKETTALARRVKANVVTLGETVLDADLLWITVPDDTLAAVAAQLAPTRSWRGCTIFHSSGALTSEALSPLRRKGAKVASVHPGMTFVRKSTPRLAGVPFAVEGDAAAVRLARQIVRELGGTAYPITARNKVLYHAFGTFASPMVIALMTTLEQVGKAAGIKPSDLRTMAAPLLRQTLDNYLEHGAAAAFSGPLVRGDVMTVRRHLIALRKVPQARRVYLALANSVVRELPVKNRTEMKRELRQSAGA